MFLCDRCHKGCKRCFGLFFSRGTCEGCGRMATCEDCHNNAHDIPASKPSPKKGAE
jgi:hypothetical protein